MESRFRWRSVVNSKSWVSQERPGRKPCWLLKKKKRSSVQGGLLRSSKLCAPGAYKKYTLMILGDNWMDRITCLNIGDMLLNFQSCVIVLSLMVCIIIFKILLESVMVPLSILAVILSGRGAQDIFCFTPFKFIVSSGRSSYEHEVLVLLKMSSL